MFTSVMTTLYSADIGRAVTFYRDLLGGVQTFQFPREGSPEHVELRIGDVTIAITRREAVEQLGMPSPTRGHPMELVLWCDAVDEAVAALRTAGTPVLLEPQDHVAGMRRAYVEDPDGNWLALVSKSAGT